ncbi:MAG: hypothetical protein N2235_09535 [Fischerella sp.]|nr:hypothetical protein [Fischerella sp.]
MQKRNLIYLLFTLTLFGILGFSYYSQRSPAISCQQWRFHIPQSSKLYTHPVKLVVEPWRGRHHVYAIFMIPKGYINDRFFKVTIKGIDTICGVMTTGGQNSFEGMNAKPGYYLIKGWLQTRMALWLMLQGKHTELQQPLNWVLGYTKTIEPG